MEEIFLNLLLYLSPSLIATPSRIIIPTRSTPPHGEASALAGRLPTTPTRQVLLKSKVSVSYLTPSILPTGKTSSELVHLACFQRSKSRWVRCYALFKGWLLLSQPSHCLRFQTTFEILSSYFGTLTSVWVV